MIKKHPHSRAERRLLNMKKELKHSDAKGPTHGIRRELPQEAEDHNEGDSTVHRGPSAPVLTGAEAEGNAAGHSR